MICIYVGCSCDIYSISTIEHPKGAEYTSPISIAMQCVINLAPRFFSVQLMVWAHMCRSWIYRSRLLFEQKHYGECVGHSCVLSNACDSLCGHSHARSPHHGQQRCSSGLGTGWHVHGNMGRADAIPPVPHQTMLHRFKRMPSVTRMWMCCCTYVVMMMAFIACVIPIFTGEVIAVDTVSYTHLTLPTNREV